MSKRTMKEIDENLINKLKSELLTFQKLRKQSSSPKDSLYAFFKLTSAFHEVIEARNRAIDQAITKEDMDRAILTGDYKVTIVLDYNIEKLLETVNKEIIDYTKNIE